MIKTIKMYNCTPYQQAELVNCKKINFVFGSNGSGKSTISSFLAGDNPSRFSSSDIEWDGEPHETVCVYNRQFRQRNFKQTIPGVFTLGSATIDDINALEQLKQDLELKRDEWRKKAETYRKQVEEVIPQREAQFREDSWNQILKPYETDFQKAFEGLRGSKDKFVNELKKHIQGIPDHQGTVCELPELKERARTLFVESPESCNQFVLDINRWLGCCFYGVLKSDFKSGIMKYGVEVIPSHGYTIPYEYFQSFRDNYADDEHKKTVIVFDLWKLYNMIIEKAVDLGALREEIYISTVYYVNKHIPFCTLENFPFEFFLKDEEFSAQSELRIIIASHNIQFYKRLEELNNNLTLGDISSFSVIQDKYAFDLDLSIQGNGLIYKLAKPISLTLEQRSFKELVGELYQIKQNRLPGEPKTQNELDKLAHPIINHLRDKYGVLYRDDWRLYNVPYNEYLTLPDLHKGMCGSVVDPSD